MPTNLAIARALTVISGAVKDGTLVTRGLRGMRVVFTGTLSVRRTEMEAFAGALGMRNQTSITNSTNILVLGTLPSSAATTAKLEAARRLHVTILNETEFVEYVRDRLEVVADA